MRLDLKGLDLNLLVVLDVLLVEKNITRTGLRLNISQPGTSSALAKLRDFFNDPLLIQVGHKMELTPFADSMVEPIREVILKSQAIVERNQMFQPSTSTRTFRMNMSDYEAAVIMSSALDRIRELAPQVRVEISSITDEPTRLYLERGYLDLIITPSDMASPLHPSERCFDDQYAVVVRTDHPLARKGMTMDAYLAGGHIVPYVSKLLPWSLDEIFLSRAGYRRSIEVVVPTFSMLFTQVVGTNLIATIQERLARFYARYFPIRVFPLPHFDSPP